MIHELRISEANVDASRQGTWTSEYLMMIVLMLVTSTSIICLLFFDHLIAMPFIAGGVVVAMTYFSGVRFLFKSWLLLPASLFIRRLLIWALVSRLMAALILYYFYQWQTGQPFEYNAVDSKFYHQTGVMVASHFNNGDFRFGNYLLDLGFSDQGYNVYLGFVYSLFGKSILAVRMLNAIFSAFTVLLIYKLAKQTLRSEYIARLSAVMALLLPNFLLYLGTHLKETLMLFVVMSALNISVALFSNSSRRLQNSILLLILLLVLFMFRTVLAATVVAAFCFYGFSRSGAGRGLLNKIGTLVLLGAFMYLVFLTPVGNEVGEIVEKYATNQTDNMEFRATREGGNKYALLAGAPLFLSVILIAPFPSMVYVPEQDLLWMFIGANFIRNAFGIFVVAGIVFLARNHFRQGSLLLAYLGGYLLVLANSGFAISERFHLPVVPILLIFTAAGISRYGNGLKRFYPWYLVAICVLVVGWNYIKIAGRS
jgi:hypothetical protein